VSAEIPAPRQVDLRILSPDQVLYEGQALWVQVPLVDGYIGIWPDHAPLVGSLGSGRVHWETGRGEREFLVQGGMLRVDADRCTILVGRSGPERQGQTEELFQSLEGALSDSLSEEEIHGLQEG